MTTRVGDVVEVEFLDHVEDGGPPLCFRVYGRVAVVSRKHVEILAWAHADHDEAAGDPNEKRFTIVRSAIISLRKLIYEDSARPLARRRKA